MLLSDLIDATRGVPMAVHGARSRVDITAVTNDSRAVAPGTLFCCIRGAHIDGHTFAAEAVGSGASALLVEHPVSVEVAQLVVADTRVAMGPVAAAFHGHPSDRLTLVGVTGTNGKTTVTMLLASIFLAAGQSAGVIGTLSGAHTTPEAPELQARLAALLVEGKQAVAMEVSSHALALHRVGGAHFAAAVFTNLGHDHLDFHGTMARYFEAKASLFNPELTDLAVVNVDDLYGDLLARGAPVPVVPYSMRDVTDLDLRAGRSRWTWRGQSFELPLTGRFNVSNALAAATVAIELGLPTEAVITGLASVPAVAGRFEVIDEGQSFLVGVDYAHTPDALTEVLAAAREVAGSGRVLLVFGCGGDRDHAKRPEMGAAASAGADVAVITSDNPRSEDPSAIIEAVISGIHESRRATVLVEPDRRAAVSMAIDRAEAGDVVLLAGKGHETTQTIGAEVLAFDDRAVARAALVARRARDEGR